MDRSDAGEGGREREREREREIETRVWLYIDGERAWREQSMERAEHKAYRSTQHFHINNRCGSLPKM
jgi:hypothetical protein